MCHFSDYLETTHLRRFWQIANVILQFHFDFYFSLPGLPNVRLPLRCSVFRLTVLLCFHGASSYIYLYSVSICLYYTRGFPRLFFLGFSSLVVYFLCAIFYLYIYSYACEGSLCLGGTSQIYRKRSPGVGPSVRRSALEPSASPNC